MPIAKTISNTFVVTTVEDGVSVPSYIQSQEAWSNQTTTASSATMPSDCVEADWKDYTPPMGSKTYLWRRSRTMTLNDVTMTYTPSAWVYSRLSGTNGTSITIKGSIQTAIGKNDHLPQTATEGDTLAWMGAEGIDYYYRYHNGQWEEVLVGNNEFYTIEKDSIVDGVNRKGHLVGYNYEADKWLDYGMFQGENGLTYYTHVAWAEDVTLSQSAITPPNGQTSIPNATAVTGFSIAPGEGKDWMGVMIDQTVTDSQTGTLYTWSYVKGEKGEPAETYFMQLNKSYIIVAPLEGSTTQTTISGKFYKHIAGQGNTAISKYGYLVFRWRNGNISSSSSVLIPTSGFSTLIEVTSSIEALEIYMLESPMNSGIPQTYITKQEIAIIPQGEKGEDGENGTNGADAVRLDLDNEMDSIQYNGTEKKGADVVTNATLYVGGTAISATSAGLIWEIVPSGCTATLGNASGVNKPITVTGLSQNKGQVIVHATYNAKHYYATFTVIKLIDEDKYELEVTPDAFAYNSSTATGNLTGNIRIKKFPYNAAGFSYLTSLPSGFTLTVNGYVGEVQVGTADQRTVSKKQGSNDTWTFSTNGTRNLNYLVTLTKSNVICDQETIPFALVKNGNNGNPGQNSIRLDLDNEMDSIQYNGTSPLGAVTTTATLYDGASKVPVANATWSYSISQKTSGTNDCNADWSGQTTDSKTLTVSSLANGITKAKVTITAAYNGNNYSAVFVVSRITDAPKYQITVYPNAFTYNPDQDGTTSSKNVRIRIWKFDAYTGAGNLISSLDTGCTLSVVPYNTSGSPQTAITPTYNSSDQGWKFTTNIAQCSSYEITLAKGTEVLDFETVPVARVANGYSGSSPVVADLTNEMDSIPMDDDGKVVGPVTVSTTIKLFQGTDPQTLESLTSTYSHANVTLTLTQSTGVVSAVFANGVTLENDKAVIPISASCRINGTTYTRTLDFVVQGVRGGESPTIYSLSLSANEIKVSNGTRTPSTLTVNRIATTKGVSSNTTYGYVSYQKDNGNEQTYVNGAGQASAITFDMVNNITFRYYKDNTKAVLLDSESVPVVYDGDDGEPACWIDVQVAEAYVTNGVPTINLSWYVRNGDGSIRAIAGDTNLCYIKLSNYNSWGGANTDETTNTYDDGDILSTQNYNNDTHVLIVYGNDPDGTNPIIKASTTIPIVKNGTNGSDGMVYEIHTNKDSIYVPSGQNTVTFSDTAYFYKKEADGELETANVYYGLYTRVSNNFYSRGTSNTAATSLALTNQVVSRGMDAYGIIISNSQITYPNHNPSTGQFTLPTNYIARKEILLNKQGDAPKVYEIVVTSSEARIDASGVMHGHLYWKLYSVQGDTRTELENINATSGHAMQLKLNTANSWTAATWNSTSIIYTDNGLYDGIDWKSIRSTLSAIPSSVELRYVINNIIVAHTEVEFSIQGQMGKNYYYDGDWSATKTYTQTTYSTPFVSRTTIEDGMSVTRNWVLTADTSTAGTVPSSEDGNPWTLMTNDFKYLISEAIFTNFAKLGASVFNGDYMFSQHGYAVGYGGTRERVQDGSMFQYVDPENMDGTPQDVDDELTIWYETPNSNIMGEGDVQIDTAQLTSGLWYTFKIEGRGSAANETLEWILDAGGYYVATGSLGYNGDNVYQNNIVNFRYDSQENLTLYVYETSGNRNAKLRHYSLRLCGFTPTYYLNLRTGQLVANDVTARGAIYATEGEFNGKLSIGSGDKFIVDPNTGELTVNGYSNVNDDDGFPIDTNSEKIDLFKLFYQFDPDSLARVARLLLNSRHGSMTFDAIDGISFSDGGHESWNRSMRLGLDGLYWYDGNGNRVAGGLLYVDENGFLKVTI